VWGSAGAEPDLVARRDGTRVRQGPTAAGAGLDEIGDLQARPLILGCRDGQKLGDYARGGAGVVFGGESAPSQLTTAPVGAVWQVDLEPPGTVPSIGTALGAAVAAQATPRPAPGVLCLSDGRAAAAPEHVSGSVHRLDPSTWCCMV